MKKRGKEGTVHRLKSLAALTIMVADMGKLVKNVRLEEERAAWHEQKDDPDLERPVANLGLSMRAEKLIPTEVTTIGELCEYRGSELDPDGGRYLREIWDSLRALGLVLRPED